MGAALVAASFALPAAAAAQVGGDVVTVEIATTHGDITADIYVDRAPITARNFLDYVDEGFYDGGTFYRSVRMDNQPNDSVLIEVIQAGPDRSVRSRSRPSIPLERTTVTGLAHVDGALSMARGSADSATSSFFICIGDQPSLDFGGNRNLDGQGFAVFGQVTSGMDVVRRIQMGEVDAQRLLEPVVITSVRRVPDPVPEARLRAAGAYLDSLTEGTAIPGLTAGVAFADGSTWAHGSGWSDTIAGVEMSGHDRMLQGSVGKTYFGAVALQLVAEGRLDLEAPISDHLGSEPWFGRIPNAPNVTLRQLMSHTSGIVRYEFNPAFLEDLVANPMRRFSPEERLAYLFDAEPPFAAGEGWEYSDTNFILVAMLIERVTGRSAYAEIEARVLDPLGLDDTVASDRPLVPGLVNGYAGPSNPFGAFDATLDGRRLRFNPQFEWGGGGYASTSVDLARWVRHVHEGRAFPAELLGQVRSGTPAPLGPQAQYGLGTIMMELPTGTAWGHSGFMPGYRTEAYYFPDYALAVAIQINTSHGPALPEPPLRILDSLAGILTGTR